MVNIITEAGVILIQEIIITIDRVVAQDNRLVEAEAEDRFIY